MRQRFGVQKATVSVAVARHVQPVTRPAFTVLRGREKTLHEARVSFRTLVVDKLLDVLRSRGHSNEIKVQPADQRPPVSRGGRFQAGVFKVGEDEVIGAVPRPGRVNAPRQLRPDGWLPGPVRVAELFPVLSGVGSTHGCWHLCRPRRPEFDPTNERVDLLLLQLAARRHLDGGIAHGADEEALVRLAGHDGRAGVTAAKNRLAAVQAQTGLQLLRLAAVTLKAALGEKRTDALLEEVDTVLIGCFRGSEQAQGDNQRDHAFLSFSIYTLPILRE